MICRITHSTLALLLALMFALPSLGAQAQACSSAHAVSVADGSEAAPGPAFQAEASPSTRSMPLSHGNDCGCPLHRSGCQHHVGLYLLRALPATSLELPSAAVRFADLVARVRPEPVLEGPFQPPRA